MTETTRLNGASWLTPNIVLRSNDIIERRTKNNKQMANRLPPEILSRIFAIGDEDQRNARIYDQAYYGFQDLAVVSKPGF
ncbi:hypothetical protein BDV93DRAFT_524485 [Ceratobasidium sp. AG-I]|nr:hypothetical protein BDV93DRAFT_524485 [Ceratobasidium sp. AG-I]